MDNIKKIIAEKIRPALDVHNGDIELLEVTDDHCVKVRLTGSCATCPGSQQTMTEIVERTLKESCPEIKKVISVCQVSDELINQALKILRRDRSGL